MAGELIRHLIVRAGCEGVVDFTKADTRSAVWWRYAALKLRYLRNKTDGEVDQINLQRLLANLSSGVGEADDFNRLNAAITERVQDMACRPQPWLSKKREDRNKKLVGEYVRVIGDLNDPAVRAHWDADSKALRERLANRYDSQQQKKDADAHREFLDRAAVKMDDRPVIEFQA